MTEIMGPNSASAAQMVGYWEAQSARLAWSTDWGADTVAQIADAYVSIGAREGVDGAVGFAQALKETGLFGFRTPTGARPASGYSHTQWNFAGIGATGPGVPGVSWHTLHAGVWGHLRRLRMYAAGTADLYDLSVLKRPLDWYLWGSAPTVEALGGRWAPSPTYGTSIVSHYLTPLQTWRPPPSPWAADAWWWASTQGLLSADSLPSDPVTVERLMVFLHRLDTRP
jgi:hypothetical protein